MKKTHHSEYGKLKSIYLKPVSAGFVNQSIISAQWEELNYLDQPNFENAVMEYTQFEKLIKATGAEVNYFHENNTVSMDSIYCRDASIATNYGIILCNMGKDGRMKEPSSAHEVYEHHGEKILGKIEAPGTVEGGEIGRAHV